VSVLDFDPESNVSEDGLKIIRRKRDGFDQRKRCGDDRDCAGSRVVQVKGEPAAGKSLAHSEFERFWATAEDLGMMIMFHVGGGRGPTPNPGWLNDGGGVLDFIAAYGGLSEPMMPQWALASLVKKGVLERHPKLGVIVSELGVHWVPGGAMADLLELGR
jgi:predicted TIM-barrel fold metal-dependent hydrolase